MPRALAKSNINYYSHLCITQRYCSRIKSVQRVQRSTQARCACGRGAFSALKFPLTCAVDVRLRHTGQRKRNETKSRKTWSARQRTLWNFDEFFSGKIFDFSFFFFFFFLFAQSSIDMIASIFPLFACYYFSPLFLFFSDDQRVQRSRKKKKTDSSETLSIILH